MILKFSRNGVILGMISFLFLFGMFVPSSWNDRLFFIPAYIAPFVTLIVFVGILLIHKKIQFKFLLLVIVINLIVWGATLFNPDERIRNVAGLAYILISLMFLIDFKSLHAKKYFSRIFKFTNIAVILIGFGMITYQQEIYNVFVAYYSDFYAELLPNMLERGKPVITFGTHSLAAFYLFLFFYLNIKTYSVERRKIYLLTSLIYLYFCYELSSNSGYVFMLLGIIVFVFHMRRKFLIFTGIAVTFFVLIISNPFQVQVITSEIQYSIAAATSSSANGLSGRYTSAGNQSNNIEYILENPFHPTGLSASTNSGLSYHDSGLIASTLEGTVILTLLLYGTLLYFVRKNLINKKSAIVLFVALVIMQLGYNNLFYFRSLCILPFILIYLNYLETKKMHYKNDLISS